VFDGLMLREALPALAHSPAIRFLNISVICKILPRDSGVRGRC
jgi:hypothetical protein